MKARQPCRGNSDRSLLPQNQPADRSGIVDPRAHPCWAGAALRSTDPPHPAIHRGSVCLWYRAQVASRPAVSGCTAADAAPCRSSSAVLTLRLGFSPAPLVRGPCAPLAAVPSSVSRHRQTCVTRAALLCQLVMRSRFFGLFSALYRESGDGGTRTRTGVILPADFKSAMSAISSRRRLALKSLYQSTL